MNESYFYSNFSCSLLTRVYVELAIGSAKKNLFISFLGLGIVVGETWLDIKLDACGANSVCLTLSRCFPLPSVAFITVKNCLHKCTGPWSEEEQQKLCELVLKCLHLRISVAYLYFLNLCISSMMTDEPLFLELYNSLCEKTIYVV
jgi:hypothetical protein